MDHTVILFWVLLSTTAYATTMTTAVSYSCGETFTEPSWSFSGPFYNGDRSTVQCLWTIQSTEHLPIKITIEYLTLDCANEYIAIFNGEVDRSVQLGRICNGSSWTFISHSGTMKVLLHRDSKTASQGFFAYYDIGELGPTTYPTTTALPVPTTEGLPFPTTEALPVPTTEALPVPTTEALPVPTTEALPVPTTEGSFRCGGNLSAANGSISSPYYPGHNMSIMCIWEIQAADYDRIVLYFNDVTILNCVTDYIAIYDGSLGSRYLGTVCSFTHRNYMSTSNTMTLVLHRQSDQKGNTFSAYYSSYTAGTAPSPSLNTTGVPQETTVAIPGVNQCGGNLSRPFGSFSGPYYPGNNVSMQCVWEIKVSSLNRIALQFSYISLDCNEEYIAIFDGSPSPSELLGKTCSNIYLNYSYISTSNKMTVLLYRDSNDPGNGFYANYYSIPPETTPSAPPLPEITTEFPVNSSLVPSRALSCSGEYMRVLISKAYLHLIGYDAWEVYLNTSDPGCRPQFTHSYVIFNIPFSGCGTLRQQKNNNSIIYSNIIMTSVSGYIITRKTNFQFHVACEMNKNTVVETMFIASNSVDISEKKYGNYNVTLAFYESSSYFYEIHESPYYVSLNQDLYLQATLHSSDHNLVLFLDTCESSPNADDFTTLTYDLVRSGCKRDSTYRNLSSPNSNAVRFKFNAFKFLNHHNEVYLQCKLIVCREDDFSSRCYKGCLPRKKREADEPQEKVDVKMGPFRVQREANEARKQELVKSVSLEKNEGFSPLTVSTVLLAAMVFVLSGFLLRSKLRGRNYQQIY